MITRKKRGPPATGKGMLIGVRLQPSALGQVDRWAHSQKDNPSRPEAIRRLVEIALAKSSTKRHIEPDKPERATIRAKKAEKALELAAEQVDRLSDPLATDDERQLRKRKLIKGPKEFRDIRDSAKKER